MTRLRLTSFFYGLSAICLAGCSGQTVQGLWLGGFPTADSRDCQIRIKEDGRFSLNCKDTNLMAIGRYRWNGVSMKMQVELLSINKVLSARKPVYELRVKGKGNAMQVSTVDRIYSWTRKPL